MNMRKKLREFFTMTRRAEEGFTLVELIVVIAIVAILGGVAVPAYSGYIEKADRAADAQLLADVNKAFAAACMVKGVDNYNAGNATASIGTDMKIDAVEISGVEGFNDTFASFFDNEGAFKTEDVQLFYKSAIGGFTITELSEAYQHILQMLTGEGNKANIDALMSSVFGSEIGIPNLMNKVDFVSTLAAELLKGNPDGTLADLILGKNDENNTYAQILAGSLGFDLSNEKDGAAFVEKFSGIMKEKMELLKEKNPEKYADDSMEEGSPLYTDAYNQIATNNAVLNAAKYSDSQKDAVMELLGGTSATGTLLANIKSDTAKGLSQASMAYGMYVAYATRENIQVSDNPADVLLKLDNDQGFKDYIKGTGKYSNQEAQNDLNGYLGSMNMINNAQQDSAAVEDVLVNGFANDALIGVLQQATK